MKLLCRVATQHDPSEGQALMSTGGWKTTIQMIRETVGERPPKRVTPSDTDDDDNDDETKRLAKRVRGVRLV